MYARRTAKVVSFYAHSDGLLYSSPMCGVRPQSKCPFFFLGVQTHRLPLTAASFAAASDDDDEGIRSF